MVAEHQARTEAPLAPGGCGSFFAQSIGRRMERRRPEATLPTPPVEC